MTDQHTELSRDLPDSQIAALEPSDDTSTATTEQKKPHSIVREVIETLLLALLIFVAVRAVVLNFRVDGHSMDNSLDNNEMLLVNRNAYFSFDKDKWFGWIPGVDTEDGDISYLFGTPERGDIVVLNPPADKVSTDKPYIKRVIGIPGDTIEIHDQGVYINGTRLDEPYIDGRPTNCDLDQGEVCGPLEVPADSVFVMGDNRTNSSDSRVFGLVPIDNIIGKAWVTYWPVNDIGVVPHNDYPELEGQADSGE